MKKLDKSNITVRQYEALVLICTKHHLENKYPEPQEIKTAMETGSDRELQNCLKALDRKGFINFKIRNGNPIIKLSKEALDESKSLIDKLFVEKKKINYKDLQKKVINKRKDSYVNKFENLFADEKQIELWDLEEEKPNINKKGIIHGWYYYLQEFPNELILNKAKFYNIKEGDIILDPFAGSGTTLVTSKMLGINSIGVETNPLMCFVSRVKTDWDIDIEKFKRIALSILCDLIIATKYLSNLKLESSLLEKIPPMELKQWLKPKLQNQIAYIKQRLSEIKEKKIKNLLLVALCKSMFESSNVALCPGTSFYPLRAKPDFIDAFSSRLSNIYKDLHLVQSKNHYGKATIIQYDSRKMSEKITNNSISLLVTSPPYPNDLEYTRQTRLEMYLLDFVKDMEEVREIKKTMIRGSTKLIFKEDNNAKYVEKFKSVQKVANKIGEELKDKNWGWDYPRMIREYFGDMYLCLKECKKVLKKGAPALFVVGDQTYKNVVIPVGKILAEMGQDLGYEKTDVEFFRMRRSTMHKIPLPEEITVLIK